MSNRPWDSSSTRIETQFNFVGPARSEIEDSLDFITDNVLGWTTPTKQALELTKTNFDTNSSTHVKKIAIVLSDGLATTGSPVRAAEELAADDVTVHTIYFAGNSGGYGQLQTISEAGGGLSLRADNEDELSASFDQILALLSVRLVE